MEMNFGRDLSLVAHIYCDLVCCQRIFCGNLENKADELWKKVKILDSEGKIVIWFFRAFVCFFVGSLFFIGLFAEGVRFHPEMNLKGAAA
jgi:hypothetical protein